MALSPWSCLPVSHFYLLAQTCAAVTTELIVEQFQPQICEYRHEATGSVFIHSSVYVHQAVFSKYCDNGFIHFGHGQSPASVLKFVLSRPTAQRERGAVSPPSGEFSFACSLLICHSRVFAVEDTGRQGASEREAFDARIILKVGSSSVTQFSSF